MVGAVVKPPVAAGRDIGIAAGAEVVFLAVEREPDLAFGDEDHAFGDRVGLGQVGAAAGADLHHVLREGFGKARHRPGDEPEAGVLPARQVARHDVGKAALRDDAVGLGEDGAAGHQAGLRRQAALRGVVGAGAGSSEQHVLEAEFGDAFDLARRPRRIRCRCRCSMRRSKAARIAALVLSRTAMMKGKPWRAT